MVTIGQRQRGRALCKVAEQDPPSAHLTHVLAVLGLEPAFMQNTSSRPEPPDSGSEARRKPQHRCRCRRSVRSMTENTQDQPVMAGSDDATNHEKLAGLIEQVDHDHGDEGAAAMADHLRDRAEETGVEVEDPAETED